MIQILVKGRQNANDRLRSHEGEVMKYVLVAQVCSAISEPNLDLAVRHSDHDQESPNVSDIMN